MRGFRSMPSTTVRCSTAMASALTIIGQEQHHFVPSRIGELYLSEDDFSHGRYLPPGTT